MNDDLKAQLEWFASEAKPALVLDDSWQCEYCSLAPEPYQVDPDSASFHTRILYADLLVTDGWRICQDGLVCGDCMKAYSPRL